MRFSKMAVAINQHHEFNPFSRSQICRLQSLTHLDYNQIAVHSLKQAFEVENIHRSVSTPCLSINVGVEEDQFDSVTNNNNKNPKIEIVGGCRFPRVRALVVEVAIAMASGVEPLPVSSGLGGAYFLRTKSGDNIAVAKPIDEEPLAFNNPKGFGGLMLGQPGMKRSVRVGESGIRELAAYLLDHQGFVGVPPTALVKISHLTFHVNDGSPTPYKIASLQRFVHHDFDAGDLGSSGFSVSSVHRIGIFDVRLLNLDRHAGNLLVKKHNQQQDNYSLEAAELVPIDHGLCLPEWLDDPYFEWLHWPQASVPFTDCELEYISDLNPFKDADFLRIELPSLGESSLRVLVLCTIFLKQAAAAGLCLADIGEMMTREFCSGEETFSVLETLCAEAKASVTSSYISDDDDDDDEDDDSNGSKEESDEIFQFEYEIEATSNDDDKLFQVRSPPKMMSKLPPRIPRLSSIKSMPGLCEAIDLSPLYEEISDHDSAKITLKDVDNDEDNSSGECEDSKVGCLTRSMSYHPLQNYNHESGGISFGDMTEGEWEMFLESFEKLLPQVLEGTKCMGLKQRLGTSCKF